MPPLYEYACDSCKHRFEERVSSHESPAPECPKCGKLKARRQITGGNFILKGGGWYETDFKSGSKKNLAGDGGTGKAPAKDGAAA